MGPTLRAKVELGKRACIPEFSSSKGMTSGGPGKGRATVKRRPTQAVMSVFPAHHEILREVEVAGKPGRGGQNRLSADEHRLRGTFRKDRHAGIDGQARPDLRPVSLGERRRVLAGLEPAARRLAVELLDTFSGWDPSSLQTLRLYVQSSVRLEAIADPAERRRETRPLDLIL
jgi:hypothetical protein